MSKTDDKTEPIKRSTYIEPTVEEASTAPDTVAVPKIPEFLREKESGLKEPEPETPKAEAKESKVKFKENVTQREASIAQARSLILGDREDAYGDPQMSFQRISDIWSAVLGMRVTEKQVAIMMMGLKLARLSYDPDDHDSYIDMIGYAALGSEVRETITSRKNLAEAIGS